MDAVVGPVHDALVGPFEIEGVDEGLAQPLVLELVAPGIEEPALGARWRLVLDDVALDAPIAERRKIVARGPDAGGEFLAEKVALAGEAFEGDVAIAVKLVAHDIEIVVPARDRQVGAPPVLDPLVFDVAAGLEAPDLVGAAAERHVERGLVERAARIVGTREYRQRCHEQRHVAPTVGHEAHDHGGVIDSLSAGEVAQHLLSNRVPLLLEDFQREGNIVGGERAAVVELDARPHQETAGEPIRRYLHGARSQPVQGIGLVRSCRHQACEGELHALRAVALEDEAVERIESVEVLVERPARPDMGEHAALRRIRVDVIEMLEVRGIFEIAECRHAVAFGSELGLRALRQGRPRDDRCDCAGAENERVAARHIADIDHWRVPALAAFSASHHHTIGNAAEAYSGNGSGRPKRSQRAVRDLS